MNIYKKISTIMKKGLARPFSQTTLISMIYRYILLALELSLLF